MLFSIRVVHYHCPEGAASERDPSEARFRTAARAAVLNVAGAEADRGGRAAGASRLPAVTPGTVRMPSGRRTCPAPPRPAPPQRFARGRALGELGEDLARQLLHLGLEVLLGLLPVGLELRHEGRHLAGLLRLELRELLGVEASALDLAASISSDAAERASASRVLPSSSSFESSEELSCTPASSARILASRSSRTLPTGENHVLSSSTMRIRNCPIITGSDALKSNSFPSAPAGSAATSCTAAAVTAAPRGARLAAPGPAARAHTHAPRAAPEAAARAPARAAPPAHAWL